MLRIIGVTLATFFSILMPMKQIRSLFPTLIYTSPLDSKRKSNLVKDLTKEAKIYQKLDREGQDWSKANYPGGYTSYSSITDLPYRSSTFGDFKRLVDKHVKNYIKALEMDLKGRELAMTTCWMNIMGPMCHHSLHLHPLSSISGTVWLQTPKGCGSFKVEDPRMACFMAGPPRSANCSETNQRFVSFDPKPGDLILFESWLRHEVTANRSDKERISISFNYDWI